MDNSYKDREKVAFIQGFNFNNSKTLSENYSNLIVFSEPYKVEESVNVNHIFKDGRSYTPVQGVNSNNNSFVLSEHNIKLDSNNYGVLSLTKSSIPSRYFYTGALSNYNNDNLNNLSYIGINDFLQNNITPTNYDINDDYFLCIDSLEHNNKIQININEPNVVFEINYKTIEDFKLSNNENNEHNKIFENKNEGLYNLITLNKGERLYIKNITITTTTTNNIYKNLVNIQSTGKFNLMGDLTLTSNNENNTEKFTSNYNNQINIIPYLFSGSKVVDASKLILFKNLNSYIFCGLFKDCKYLEKIPKLPTTTLASHCYAHMFEGCISLVNAPELPAGILNNDIIEGTLAERCYESMFSGCTSLTTAPELPAISLTEGCYEGMFSGCTSLSSAPELPAENLVTDCYKNMFNGCSKLNYINAQFITNIIDVDENNKITYPYTSNWVENVAKYGTFIKNDNWNIYEEDDIIKNGILGENGIPILWVNNENISYNENTELDYKSQYLTIERTSEESVKLQWPTNTTPNNHKSIYYSNDKTTWNEICSNKTNTIILNDQNNKVYLKGNNDSYVNDSYEGLGFKNITLNITNINSTIICTYNITSINEEVNLLYYSNDSIYSGFEKNIKTIIIDNKEVNISNKNKYKFNTIGNHIVKFILKDNINYIGKGAFRYCTNLTSVIIPNSVTSIGDYAFSNCYELTSIYIPNDVTYIGSSAFSSCTNIKSINLPNNLTYISENTFFNCNSLTSIIIPDLITSIGDNTFNGCTNIKFITLGKSIISIGNYVFDGCSNLISIICKANIAPTIQNYTFGSSNNNGLKYNGYLIVSDNSTGYDVWMGTANHDYHLNTHHWSKITYLNNNIICIYDASKKQNDGLVRLSGHNPNEGYYLKNVTSMEIDGNSNNFAYLHYFNDNNYHIVKYIFNTNLTSIDEGAFQGCPGLISIIIPDSVTAIGDYAFSGCSELTSITIPDLVTSIGMYAFNNCENLTSINILDNINKIGMKAFAGCIQITSINIPNNMTLIDWGTFHGCSNLIYVNISNNITRIDSHTFNSCSNLIYIIIPNSVTSIGNYAFNSCSSLTSIRCEAITAPTISSNTFQGIISGGTLTVPTGSTGYDTWMETGDYYLGQYNWNIININNDLNENKNAFKVYGNIMSLFYDDFKNKFKFNKNTSYNLKEFFKNINVVDASNLMLPATLLTEGCYEGMFSGCTSLTTAPELPAETLADSCYAHMFEGCKLLTTAPKLDTETLAESCYESMFKGCTSLTTTPELHATTLADSCYAHMFEGCKLLTSAPKLDTETLAESCYESMFKGCTNLTTITELGAITLAISCYKSMFQSCTSLTNVPENLLSIETLAESCYESMFKGCTTLETVPELPATNLSYEENGEIKTADSCYAYMFEGCTALETAPVLLAETLVENCYAHMFEGCISLNYIKCLAKDISATNCTSNWVKDVDDRGDFYRYNEFVPWEENCNDGIPVGWSIYNEHDINYTDIYFTIESEEDENEIYYGINGVSTTDKNYASYKPLYYSTDNGQTWTYVIPFANTDYFENYNPLWCHNKITTLSKGEKICFKANNDTYGNIIVNDEGISKNLELYGSEPFKVYGNIMSLFYGDDFRGQTSFKYKTNSRYLVGNECYGLLKDSNVTDASNLILPANVVSEWCYANMFTGCKKLTKAPELPATTLNRYCYYNMFSGCELLKKAPELPALSLSEKCYAYMFYNCKALTNVPKLSAISLEDYCCWCMFYGCTSLEKAPILSSTGLKDNCYNSMFYGCTKLNEIHVAFTTNTTWTTTGPNWSSTTHSATENWLYNVASSGTFYCPSDAEIRNENRGSSSIPNNWDILDSETIESNNSRAMRLSIQNEEENSTNSNNIENEEDQIEYENIKNYTHKYIISNITPTHAYILIPTEWENHLDIYIDDEEISRGHIFNIDDIIQLRKDILIDECRYNFYKTIFTCKEITYKMSSL